MEDGKRPNECDPHSSCVQSTSTRGESVHPTRMLTAVVTMNMQQCRAHSSELPRGHPTLVMAYGTPCLPSHGASPGQPTRTTRHLIQQIRHTQPTAETMNLSKPTKGHLEGLRKEIEGLIAHSKPVSEHVSATTCWSKNSEDVDVALQVIGAVSSGTCHNTVGCRWTGLNL